MSIFLDMSFEGGFMSINFKDSENIKIDSILLSAGLSQRMGTDKALLQIDGKKVIFFILEKLSLFSDKIFIILGANYHQVKKVLLDEFEDKRKIEFVYNENYKKGMFSSIIKGFCSVSGKNPILLQMIDQPFISLETYQKLISNFDRDHLIFQPIFSDDSIHAGHPILFSNKFKDLLLTQKNKKTLRDVLELFNNKRKLIAVNDKSIYHNLNDPEKFEKIKKEYVNGNTCF